MLTYQVDKMKSQASSEFLTIVMIILIFIMIIFISTSALQLSAQKEEVLRKVRSICGDITEKINKAIYFGLGFSQNVSLPDDVFGTDYNLKISDNKTLICSTEKFSIIDMFVENEITNTTDNPPFTIPKKEIKISNSGGVVVIS